MDHFQTVFLVASAVLFLLSCLLVKVQCGEVDMDKVYFSFGVFMMGFYLLTFFMALIPD